MKYLLLCFSFALSFASYSQPFPSAERFATGLDRPVNIQNAGDERLFVLELDGYIKIIEADGTVKPEPFLNMDEKVKNISGPSEQGLLGLAFHPNYVTNGFFFVNYVNNDGDTVISRFSRSSENSADPDSELILLQIEQPYSNHNGGCMAFGSDGYLYIAVGDGGSGGDPQDNAQDLSKLLGSILRIDIDNPDAGLNYGIPENNPFVSDTSARDEIWAYGVRNPWKFSFDRINNEIWIADVGQGQIEEINLLDDTQKGVNLGWRCYEGNNPYNLAACPPSTELTFPVAQYNHSMSRCSITGGYRYRGSEMTQLYGLYFFADYCTGEIGTIEQDGSNYVLNFLEQFTGLNWSTFGEDNNGELYLAAVNTGEIWKMFESELLDVDEFSGAEIKLFPNPSSNKLNVSINKNSYGSINLNIIDISGRIIKSPTVSSSNDFSIDILDLNAGIYFLQIENGKNKAIKKFIKY